MLLKVCSMKFEPPAEFRWTNPVPAQLWLFLVKITSSWRDFINNRHLKQTDAAVERRRSHSNLHSILGWLMSRPTEFTWPWVLLNRNLLADRRLSAVASVCLRSLMLDQNRPKSKRQCFNKAICYFKIVNIKQKEATAIRLRSHGKC